ncbi:hypothetical protein [Amycolatopsis sp. cmx-4-68]
MERPWNAQEGTAGFEGGTVMTGKIVGCGAGREGETGVVLCLAKTGQ